MSAWKSPLLYLGIALILLSAAAFAVPYFYDWNKFRPDIAAYAEKLTGRAVTISGNVTVRLFPWPYVRLKDVAVANPQGARLRNLFRADELEASIRLGPLVSGRIEVEAIRIDKPVIGLAIAPDGTRSWKLTPARNVMDTLGDHRLSLDRISVVGGVIEFAHGLKDEVERLTLSEATLSAPALAGPWRVRGKARFRNLDYDIGINTGKARDSHPFKVAARATPDDRDGWGFFFDGDWGDKVTGNVRFRHAFLPGNTQSTRKPPPAIILTASLDADERRVAFGDIELSQEGDHRSGKLLGGGAVITFGPAISIATSLRISELNLDEMFGSRQAALLNPAVGLPAATAALGQLPQGWRVSIDMNVLRLISRGETLDQFRLVADAETGRLRISNLSARMPGQTFAKFTGSLIPSRDIPQLSGTLTAESIALRDFAMWAMPQARQSIARVWSGARGRAKLSASVDITPEWVRLTGGQFGLDDASGTGSLKMNIGSAPSATVRLALDHLDFDRYAPDGITEAGIEGGYATGLLDLVGKSMGFGAFQFTLHSDRLQMAGMTLDDLVVGFNANADSVTINTIEIGSLDGARIDVTGSIRFPANGVAGNITTNIAADDVTGLMRLAGFEPTKAPLNGPDWKTSLRPVKLKIVTDASTSENRTRIDSRVFGNAGQAAIDLKVDFAGDLRKPEDGDVDLSGHVASESSRALAEAAGLKLYGGQDRPARLDISALGTPSRGLKAKADLAWLDTRAAFNGNVILGGDVPVHADGKLTFRAERAGSLYEAFGLGVASAEPRPELLFLKADTVFGSETWRFNSLRGQIAGSDISGALELTQKGDSNRLGGSLAFERLDLGWLLSAFLLPRSEKAPDLTTRLELAHRLPFTGAVSIKAGTLTLVEPVVWNKASAKFAFTEETVSARARAGGDGKIDRAFELRLERSPVDLAVAGTFSGPLDLGAVLKAESGKPVLVGRSGVKMQFSGRGRTAAAILASAFGSGSFDLANPALGQADVPAFASGLRKAKTVADVNGLVSEQLTGGQSRFDDRKGRFSISGGVMDFEKIPLSFDGAAGHLKLLVELATGKIDLSTRLKVDGKSDLPEFEIAYAGPPRALAVSTDVAALNEKVNQRELNRGIRELERLNREQRRLLREESDFERLQVMRQREADNDARLRAIAEKRAEKARLRAEAEEKERLRLEEEARLKAEAEEKERLRLEEEARLKAEAKEKERQRREAAERKRKAEEERKARALALKERRKRLRAEMLERRRKAREARAARRKAAAEEQERLRLEKRRKAREARAVRRKAAEEERERLRLQKLEEERKAEDVRPEAPKPDQNADVDRAALPEIDPGDDGTDGDPLPIGNRNEPPKARTPDPDANRIARPQPVTQSGGPINLNQRLGPPVILVPPRVQRPFRPRLRPRLEGPAIR